MGPSMLSLLLVERGCVGLHLHRLFCKVDSVIRVSVHFALTLYRLYETFWYSDENTQHSCFRLPVAS